MQSTLLLLLLSVLLTNVNAGCNVSFYGPSSIAESPHYPDMYDVGNCYYFIKVPLGKALALFWLHFNVGTSKEDNQCRGDSVTVYDGTMFSPLRRWTFCGNEEVRNLTSTSNMMTLWFKSNSTQQYDGFQVQYDSFDVPCVTQTYQGNLGIIKSPHFPQPFPVPSCSIYRIQVPAGRVIKLTWNKFSISPNVPVSSCLNYIELYDRWLKSENKIYKFCSGDKLPPSFTSSSNTVYLTFTASTISSLNSGFEGVYRSITRDVCNIKSETPTGAITVPNNPSYLHLDLDCFVTINIIDIDYIILRWVEFGPQLFDNPSLCKNYIAIYNGLINSTDLIMSLKMCQEGNATTLPVKSKNLINVRYRVWDYNHFKNFRFFYIGVSSQQLQKKIRFSNASCEDIEWYYEAPFGNVVVESTLSCKEPASKLATWVMIVIFCGVGLASTVLIIVSGCLLARYLQRSRQRYRNL